MTYQAPPGYKETKRRIRFLRRELEKHPSERSPECPDDLTQQDLDEWEERLEQEVWG